MAKQPKNAPAPDRLAAVVSTLFLTLAAAGLLVLGILSGYTPLVFCGLLLALPALIHLVLLLPVRLRAKNAPVPEDGKRHPFHGLKGRFAQRYNKARGGIVTALAVIFLVAAHLVFWKLSATSEGKLGYHLPVILAVLFVGSLVLEKWCKYAAREQSYPRALLRGLQSALQMGRIAMLLTAVTLMLRLLDLYDAQKILQVLLGILFVYESVFLAFSLAVRVIRHELSTAPELLIPMPGLGQSDMHILNYLESNTGITMRSLWSMTLVKKLLPGAIIGIALVLWLSTGVVQIQSHQEGALYRLGKMQDETLKPGFHLTLPWPFDQVEVYDTQVLNRLTIGYTAVGDQDNTWTETHGSEEHRLLLGGGSELISINLQIEYRIADLPAYVRNNAKPESILEAAGYEIVTARTISSDLDTMLGTNREAFSTSFREELTEHIAPFDTGLEVVNVVLESIHPPVEVARIFQSLISAGIDAEHMLLLAQNDANTAINTALNQQAVTVGDARVQYFTEIGNAESAVSEFMASVDAYEAYPDAYTYYKYMNAMIQAYSGARLIIVGEGVDTRNLYIGGISEAPTEPEETPYEYEEEEFDYDLPED